MGFEAEIDNSERNGVVDNLQEEIICSICRSIFEDPMKLDCCDGHFCKECFETVKKNSPNCPLCRKRNFTAKFSRLMVTVLSQYKLFCPAQECKKSVNYANFAQHKKSCPILNRKPCQNCKKDYLKEDFEEHFSCFEKLNKNAEIDKKKIAKLESEVEEARMTIEQLITTNESENRELRNKSKKMKEKIKILEEKLKNEEEKNRAGNQEKIQQSAIQEKNEELEKIKKELGKEGGAGYVFGEDRRPTFNEEKVRQILRGLKAGLTEVNLKFRRSQNLEVREGGLYLRHQSSSSNYGGDGFWKIWLTRNGRRVEFETDADDTHGYDVRNSANNLRPDSNGMAKFKGGWSFVRWNITIEK